MVLGDLLIVPGVVFLQTSYFKYHSSVKALHLLTHGALTHGLVQRSFKNGFIRLRARRIELGLLVSRLLCESQSSRVTTSEPSDFFSTSIVKLLVAVFATGTAVKSTPKRKGRSAVGHPCYYKMYDGDAVTANLQRGSGRGRSSWERRGTIGEEAWRSRSCTLRF
jgi:hypothetical protein